MSVIERAIVYLAERCDGAHQLDGQGFNSTDAFWGRQLAKMINIAGELSNTDRREAMARLHKYRVQLAGGGIDLDVDNPLSSDDIAASILALQAPPPVLEKPLEPHREIIREPQHNYTATEPPKKPEEPIPTEEQSLAIDKIFEWIAGGGKQFKLGGYAGTGKTFLIKLIKKRFKKIVIVCAFTGKAVHVLAKKGVLAQTMHSLMYDVEILPKGQVKFHKKEHLDACPQLIIVDEASMVSKDLYNDLMSFRIPVLFIGDPGQLPPVGDNPDLMASPDFVLTKIHRQAEQSPIISLATRVRKGGTIQRVQLEDLLIREKSFKASEAVKVDQIICARNKTRQQFNQGIRQFKCFDPQTIVEGDKLMCQRNNTTFGVFNGMIFFVKRIKEDRPYNWICDVEDELGNEKRDLPIWRAPFEMEIDPKDLVVPKDVVYCDYGYVITCHKSQGSEWEHVLVYDEWMPPKVWDMARWRYTAITRAAKKLTYLI